MNESRQPDLAARPLGLFGRGLLVLAASFAFSGCLTSVPYDQVTVWRPDPAHSTFPAYHLRGQGNFGAGSFPGGSAGVIFDGLYYHHVSGGRISNSSSAERLASGWAVRFRADRVDAVAPGFDQGALERRIGQAVPEVSMACAFRVVGRFKTLSVALPGGGSLPLDGVVGSIYGYRAADSARAPMTTELWFLSSDFRTGGRVTSFQVADGSLAIDLCPRYLTIHPGLPAATKDLRR